MTGEFEPGHQDAQGERLDAPGYGEQLEAMGALAAMPRAASLARAAAAGGTINPAEVAQAGGLQQPVPDALEPDPAYRSALDWVWSFSRVERSPAEKQLDRIRRLPRMRALLTELGNPERAFASVIVAGTKGKGSIVAFLDAALREGGVRTGRYTSPHLLSWRERTVVAGEPITALQSIPLLDEVRRAVNRLDNRWGQPNTFEIGTAFAFLHFARKDVELAVAEVGVGGRYDATNVLDPCLSIIGPVSHDHMEVLGPSLAEIAAQKCGVLRSGRVGIVAPQQAEAGSTIVREAYRIGAPLIRVPRDWFWRVDAADTPARIEPTSIESSDGAHRVRTQLPLLGNHQRDNATAATAALFELAKLSRGWSISARTIASGLEQTRWPGRLQLLRTDPAIVVDGAHNGASARTIAEALSSLYSFRKLHLILGVSAGKDAAAIAHALGPIAATVCLTRARHERSADPVSLLRLFESLEPGPALRVAESLEASIHQVLFSASADDLVLVTGSLFLVGEAIGLLAGSGA